MQQAQERPYREYLVLVLNRVFGKSREAEQFWNECITPGVYETWDWRYDEVPFTVKAPHTPSHEARRRSSLDYLFSPSNDPLNNTAPPDQFGKDTANTEEAPPVPKLQRAASDAGARTDAKQVVKPGTRIGNCRILGPYGIVIDLWALFVRLHHLMPFELSPEVSEALTTASLAHLQCLASPVAAALPS